MSKWILQRKAADYKGLSEKLKVDPVIVRLMVNRGLLTYEEMEEYLHPTLDNFPDPHLFADMDEACGLLMDAIDEGVKIRVVGDYDVDGIMSTYILTSAIKEVGGNVDYAVCCAGHFHSAWAAGEAGNRAGVAPFKGDRH